MVLRLGIDEYEEEEDLEGESASLPFVINRDLADRYGTRFAVFLDKNQIPSVAAVP